MFGVSVTELGVILVIALLVFGPDKLPEIARTIGKLSGELKRNADALRREFYNTVYEPAPEVQDRAEAHVRHLIAANDPHHPDTHQAGAHQTGAPEDTEPTSTDPHLEPTEHQEEPKPASLEDGEVLEQKADFENDKKNPVNDA